MVSALSWTVNVLKLPSFGVAVPPTSGPPNELLQQLPSVLYQLIVVAAMLAPSGTVRPSASTMLLTVMVDALGRVSATSVVGLTDAVELLVALESVITLAANGRSVRPAPLASATTADTTARRTSPNDNETRDEVNVASIRPFTTV